jgi:hypothetical protein
MYLSLKLTDKQLYLDQGSSLMGMCPKQEVRSLYAAKNKLKSAVSFSTVEEHTTVRLPY